MQNDIAFLKEAQSDTQSDTLADTLANTQSNTLFDTINKQNETKQNKINMNLPNPLVGEVQQAIQGKEKKTKVSQEKYFVENEKLNAAILDFIEFRKNIKNPMTERAVKLLINKLNDLAANDEQKQIAMLEQSILAGWKSVYPLQSDSKSSLQKGVQATPIKQNRFVNYEQREWNFEGLEKMERERLAQEADNNRQQPKDERYATLWAKIEGVVVREK